MADFLSYEIYGQLLHILCKIQILILEIIPESKFFYKLGDVAGEKLNGTSNDYECDWCGRFSAATVSTRELEHLSLKCEYVKGPIDLHVNICPIAGY
jgi:hypothetical protein